MKRYKSIFTESFINTEALNKHTPEEIEKIK